MKKESPCKGLSFSSKQVRSPYFCVRMLLAANWLISLIALFPHGDLDLRIREISLRIEASPSNMTLRMERGELYVQHEEYDKAKTDFSLCLKNGFDDIRVIVGLSNSYLQTGPVDSSIYYIDIVLSREPSLISAIELKSLALGRLGKYCESARILQEVISLADQPTPLLFIQSASAWKSCNEPGNMEMAIQVLKTGLARLPGNRVLQHHLTTAYKDSKLYEEALGIQSTIILASANKVRPLLNRAKTYIEIGLINKANTDLQSALSWWESLPQHKKDVPAMEELKNEIERLLTELEK